MNTRERLIFRRRWTPVWLGVLILVGYGAFGWVLLRSYSQNAEGVRVMIPAYLLLGYLVAAASVNWRRAEVSERGVRLLGIPFTCSLPQGMDRDAIWLCYVKQVRQLITSDASLFDAMETGYLAGVQDARGRALDVCGPYRDRDRALSEARRIVEVLNRSAEGRRIEVHAASGVTAGQSRWRALVALWLVAFLSALGAGALWELSQI